MGPSHEAPLCCLDGEGVVSFNAGWLWGPGAHEGTEGLSKPMKIARVPFPLVSEGSSSFKMYGL